MTEAREPLLHAPNERCVAYFLKHREEWVEDNGGEYVAIAVARMTDGTTRVMHAIDICCPQGAEGALRNAVRWCNGTIISGVFEAVVPEQ